MGLQNCRVLLVAAAAVCGAGISAGGSIIYGVGLGLSSPYTLYQLSPLTGLGTPVGPISTSFGIDAMDAATNGTILAAGRDFLGTRELVILNPATATTTVVGDVTGVPGGLAAGDYALRSDGKLFAIYGPHNLYTIDTSTAAATFLRAPINVNPLRTLAFSNGGTLYLSDAVNIYTVDQTSGAVALVTPLTFDPGFGLSGTPGMHMKFDPATGILYTSVTGIGSSSLGTINIATGAVTMIGGSVPALRPIAIVSNPEPSSWVLTATGMLTLLVWRRSLHG